MFWTREVLGWILTALGLSCFGIAYFHFLSRGYFFESGPMTFMGFIIFRGGINMLKVGAAARIAQRPDPNERPKRSLRA